MSLPKVVALSAYRGDTWKRTLLFDVSGDATALPTSGWQAQIRKNDKTSVVTGEFDIDTTGAALGAITLSLAPTTTQSWSPGKYLYDLQVTNGAEVKTYVRGTFTLMPDITHD